MKSLKSRKAVIDIDNTLWAFHEVFFERLRKINIGFPDPEHWTEWDIWKGHCPEEDFFRAINEIHFDQDNERHLPYPEARDFLSALKGHDYHIIIASHRMPLYRGQTESWLKKHALQYDELHLSFDKAVLFGMSTRVVVDDSPEVLHKARESGAISTGLAFPWNRACACNGFRLFSNLDEVLSHILEMQG